MQVCYNDIKGQLQVTVIECKDLKKMDTFGKSDPFVRVYLMPGSHPEMKTKTIKKTLDPQFKEQFSFTVRSSELKPVHFCLSCPDLPGGGDEEDDRAAGV